MHVSLIAYVAVMVTGAIAAPGVASRGNVGYNEHCNNNNDCAVGSFCIESKCSVGRDLEDNNGETCTQDAECAVGSFCINKKCSVGRDFECTLDTDCVTGSFCIGNKCSVGRDFGDNIAKECNTHEECPAGSFCTNHQCSVARMAARDLDEFLGECSTHEDCGVGSFCVAHWCTVARKLEDGSVNLAARDVVAEDVSIFHVHLIQKYT